MRKVLINRFQLIHTWICLVCLVLSQVEFGLCNSSLAMNLVNLFFNLLTYSSSDLPKVFCNSNRLMELNFVKVYFYFYSFIFKDLVTWKKAQGQLI